MSRIFSSSEIGRMVRVDASSVNRWIDSGRLRAHRTPGGHRRVLEEDLLSFLEAHELPLPDELASEMPPSILICDADEQHLRTLSRALLRSHPDLQLISCAAPLQALLRIGAHRPQLSLLDVTMPGVDWAEVCRAIVTTDETQAIRILTCAARTSAELESRVLDAGALALLPKPVRAASILRWLDGLSAE